MLSSVEIMRDFYFDFFIKVSVKSNTFITLYTNGIHIHINTSKWEISQDGRVD